MECKWYDIGCFASWLMLELKAFFVWIYESILMGIVSLFSAIPAPSFMSDIQTITIPQSVAYFAEPFQLEYGLGITLSAFVIRFLIRRLPFIG